MALEEALCMTLGDVVGAFSIASDDVDKALTAIIQNFSLLYVSNGRVRVLINVHEMVLTQDVFEELLAINDQQVPSPAGKKPTESSNQEENSSQSKDPHDQQAKGRENVAKAGRPSLVSKFPDIIPRTTELLKQHSFQAESRRRTSTATGNGVSLAEIQEHLYRTVPSLKEYGICRSTIHSLFVPPRKRTLRAQHYKSHIDAKVPGKRNSYRENHADSHFLFARVAYRQELASKFFDEVTVFSADDMNKIKVGQAAVSRYHQIGGFFMADDSPNFPDHDFPHPNYLLVPSGYMTLQSHHRPENDSEEDTEELRALSDIANNDTLPDVQDLPDSQSQPSSSESSSSVEATMELDKLGRPHLPRPRTGPAKIVLRSTKFYHSSSQVHANDLRKLLEVEVQKGKSVVFILTDNGPDWQSSSLCNLLYFMRAWRDRGRDMLLLCSFAARYSTYNSIEHLWSPLSKRLAGVILSAKLPGEDKAPCQHRLSEQEMRQKEAKVFDKAMTDLCDEFWKDHTFDGFSVIAESIPCLSNETDDEGLYSDYVEVHKLLKGSIRNARGTELLEELQFMLKHIDRKKSEVVLKKCVDPVAQGDR